MWIDQDLCTGDGLCTDHCPDMFVLLEDGISYVQDPSSNAVGNDPGGRGNLVTVPTKLEQHAIDAAVACPGECIFIEVDDESGTATGGAGDDEDERDDEYRDGIGLPRSAQPIDDPYVGQE